MPLDHRKAVFEAMDYISLNLPLNPSLNEIARHAALSSFHFHRIFREIVGETVAGFTRRLRLERAALWLIASADKDITRLALQIGFSSSQNFAKAFRSHFALSPSEFRRRYGTGMKSKTGNVARAHFPYSDYDSCGLQQIRIATLPARRVAYMRRFGSYGAETCRDAHRDLYAAAPGITPQQPAGTICLYWDSPEITAHSRCRTDVCVELRAGQSPGRAVVTQTITGGTYAVFTFSVSGNALESTWGTVFKWMAAGGLIKGDFPAYEFYYPETDISRDLWVFDICIPLKNTVD